MIAPIVPPPPRNDTLPCHAVPCTALPPGGVLTKCVNEYAIFGLSIQVQPLGSAVRMALETWVVVRVVHLGAKGTYTWRRAVRLAGRQHRRGSRQYSMSPSLCNTPATASQVPATAIQVPATVATASQGSRRQPAAHTRVARLHLAVSASLHSVHAPRVPQVPRQCAWLWTRAPLPLLATQRRHGRPHGLHGPATCIAATLMCAHSLHSPAGAPARLARRALPHY